MQPMCRCHLAALLVSSAVLVGGCYRAPALDQPCSITCTTTCPLNLTCDPTLHVCVAPGDDCEDVVPQDDVLFDAVATGTDFACGIATDRSLWCWGSNLEHQISPVDVAQIPIPTRVGAATWDTIAVGGAHLCGLRDGKLFCWGRNDVWQATGREEDLREPTEITQPGVTAWSFVATGARSTCAIGDGKLYCWGYNKEGSLGTNVAADEREPVTQVANARTDWTFVALGHNHTCAIAGAGELYCFGKNEYDKCGGGTIDTPIFTADTWTHVGMTDGATCAIKADGTLHCFGAAGEGGLGPGNTTNAATPVPVAGTGWTKLAGSHRMMCGLRAGGEVVCWGTARFGGLPAGRWTHAPADFVVALPGGATDLDVAWSYAFTPTITPSPRADRSPDHELGCALVGTELRCWGDNRAGQLGTRAATGSPLPVASLVDVPLGPIALGAAHGCGIEGGTVACWGSVLHGAASGAIAGTATTPCTSAPCDVGAPRLIMPLDGVTALAVGRDHACALHGDTVTCWGDNAHGQLGGGSGAATPRAIPGAFTKLFADGGDRTCATTTASVVRCWGDDQPASDHPELSAFVAHATGASFRCYLDAGNGMWCEGDNSVGQFGMPTPSDAIAPIATAHVFTELAASAGADHACGRAPDGTVACWGDNARGATGGPSAVTTSPFSLPLAACTAISVTAAPGAADDDSLGFPSPPYAASCAICGGDIYCWGDNRRGQLGIGAPDFEEHATPMRVEVDALPGDPWTSLHAEGGVTCARALSGATRCWGTSRHGALGTGGTPANLPVTVRALRPR